ncbi:MAG: Tetratricopeptide (TPR) repeat/Tetratricopeptide (TPR) repeat [Verrucomicrobia bacterium]|nr:MAG: Tetratricopeptide (TPR) repeat/Tetratricopeptide (TPR) repeat [Verrucomicrobiota bacterium]
MRTDTSKRSNTTDPKVSASAAAKDAATERNGSAGIWLILDGSIPSFHAEAFMRLLFSFLFFATPFLLGSHPLQAKGVPRTKTPASEPAPKENPSSGTTGTATAEEYLALAARAFAHGRWQDASDAYASYSRDFGARPETKPVSNRFQPALALCLLHQQRFMEALIPLQRALNADPPFSPTLRKELMFQSALCSLNLGDFAKCREDLEHFLTLSSSGLQFQQAHVILGQTDLLAGHPAEAADRFKTSRPFLDSGHAPQALLLELRSRIEAGQVSEALKLVQKEGTLLQESPEAVGFQNTLLLLASQLLQQGSFRDALVCLYQTRPFKNIAAFAEAQIQRLEKETAATPITASTDTRTYQTQVAKRLRVELQALKDHVSFDASVRLRLAAAYQGLQRFREAALILSDTLQLYPKDTTLEQAGVALTQNWCELECWPEAEAASKQFAQSFPKAIALPTVLFLKGIAQQKARRFGEAIETFEGITRLHPKTDLSRRAEFMRAFTQLMAGEPAAAALQFSTFLKKNAVHELCEEAASWLCVSYALAKQPENCRTAAAEYLARYPNAPNVPSVLFQNAKAAHALRDYPLAIAECNALLQRFPVHPKTGETLLLLSDAYLATENIEKALVSLQNIPATDPAVFEDGWFRAAKLLKTQQRREDRLTHLARFALNRAQSPRYADAVLWAAKWLDETGQPGEPARLVWAVIMEHNANPNIPAVETLLESLPSLLSKTTPNEHRSAPLRDWCAQNSDPSKGPAFLRAQWGLASALRRSAPLEARNLLLNALPHVKPDCTSSAILSDLAEACASGSQPDQAAALWRELLKWHPRSVHKDRALSALMLEAEKTGDSEKALRIASRFEAECPDSPRTGLIVLSKARLQEMAGDWKSSRQSLETLLLQRSASGEFKSEALLRLGDQQMKAGKPVTAIPYYQRVYVMYGRWKTSVAKAYLHSGEAFEKLGDKAAAIRTYSEMLDADLPPELPEIALAGKRLASLGGTE